MKIETRLTHIDNRQMDAFRKLRSMNPLPRFALGLLISAFAAFYIPVLLLALVGTWINVLTQWLPNALCIIVLIVLNLIGNKTGKTFLTGFIFAMIIDCYAVSLSVRIYKAPDWQSWLPNFLFINTAIPLNAYLLRQYKMKAGL